MRYLPNDLGVSRLGIAIQRRVFPKAVQRNRVKRLIREVFRRNKKRLLFDYDIIIGPKQQKISLPAYKYRQAETDILEIFGKAGIIK